MLLTLQIRNFVVIEALDLEITDGLTVITGESGAGKSIALDALQLLLGGRAETRFVRPGAEQAEIIAVFDVSALPAAVLWLSELDLNAEDCQQDCIVRRVITKEGRSRAYINGRAATRSQLKLLGEHLVQIHGQSQHQQLTRPPEQRRLLDAFAQSQEELSALSHVYKTWQDTEARLSQYLAEEASKEALSLLRYQVEELSSLDPKAGEWEALQTQHQQLANAAEDTASIAYLINELEESEQSVSRQIHQVCHLTETLSARHQDLGGPLSCLNEAAIQVDEATQQINDYRRQLNTDPAALAAVDKRLSDWFEMARKHRIAPEQLHQHFLDCQAKLAGTEGKASEIKQLEQQLSQLQSTWQTLAKPLTAKRIKAAKSLSQRVTETMQSLAMKGGSFEVSVTTDVDKLPNPDGLEDVKFLTQINDGLPKDLLSKVASGGELSRVSLAIQLVTAQFIATPTLFFDEVDVGVGGTTAALLGQSLRKLGESAQILCITHMPQVAACGHSHLHVSKQVIDHETCTSFEVLKDKYRIEEIARMVGGKALTAKTRAHAKELLEAATA